MRAALRHVLPGFVVLGLALSTLGCRHEPGVQWISLARGPGRPDALLDDAILPDGQRVQFDEHDGFLWGTVEVRREDWKESEIPDSQTTHVVFAPATLLGLGKPGYHLEVDGKECRPVSAAPEGALKIGQIFEPGTFGYYRNAIFLGLEPGKDPPETARLHVRLDAGETDSQNFHQIHGRRFDGRGLSVWTGQEYERALDLSAATALSFGTSVEAASALDQPDSRAVFRIRLEDRVLFEYEQPIDPAGTYAWHSIALPEQSGARLVFEVEGPFAYTSFMDPIIGPADRGSYAARPFPVRPSIVVFLADTFRADNLTLYGGKDVTPELDRFAEQSLRFQRAWSVGTFTLTGHSSLFSGLYPRQTASDAFSSALPESVETIAEVLTRAGYRTGAITDSGVVSLRFGLHQGFSWFDEQSIGLSSTLERAKAFLDADDGRPVFLFVQTYRTHLPYREHETPTVSGRRDFTGNEEYVRLMGGLNKFGSPARALQEAPEKARELVAGLENLYRRGARDLDRSFGAFWRDLSARGFPAAGYVVFTSDHGEAFFEHDQLFHQGKVFEEQTRVPLLIQGPDVQPRTIHQAASLIDFSPTFAAIAGAPPLPFWQGTNLLELSRERSLFAFECADAETSTIAIIQGAKKLIAREETAKNRLADPWMAFDLAEDPHETTDLLEQEAWPRELYQKAAELVDALLVPIVSGEASALDADRIQELNDLGYASE